VAVRDPKTGKFPPRGPAVSRGQGWGGAAQGASSTAGQVAEVQPMSNDPAIKRQAAERVRRLKDHLYDLALNAERQETQLSAAVAFLNREEGMPISRAVIANVGDPNNLTDAELAAIAAGSGPDAAPAPDDTGGSGGVVH
jgi:hypothetical protein